MLVAGMKSGRMVLETLCAVLAEEVDKYLPIVVFVMEGSDSLGDSGRLSVTRLIPLVCDQLPTRCLTLFFALTKDLLLASPGLKSALLSSGYHLTYSLHQKQQVYLPEMLQRYTWLLYACSYDNQPLVVE